MSFMSSKPKWYLDFKDRYYSFDNLNTLRLHNSNTEYNNLDGSIARSLIKPIVNDDYSFTKTFDNISYSADLVDTDNFTQVHFKTDHQVSKFVLKSDIDKRESTYKFYIPRNDEDELFSDRMKGKYLIGNFMFTSDNGNMFVLPMLETTYRYSMI